MKKSFFLFLSLLFLLNNSLTAQFESKTDSNDNAEITNLLGDNFSLEAALETFKNSESPEDFEALLNTENSHANNLDLNQDGEIDYIKVIDEAEKDAHAIILQAVLGEDEVQDVAVIAIEKTGNNEATLQIFGDEALYGENLIVEPFDVAETLNSDEKGPSGQINLTRIVVNVWFWNPVRFIYRPAYRPWRSPYYWGYYPRTFRHRRPIAFAAHRRFVSVYQPRFRVVRTPRVIKARRIYTPVRRTSPLVRTRTISRTRVAPYKTQRTTTKTTVVKNRNGKTVAKKRTVTNSKVRKTPNGRKVTKSKKVRTGRRN